MGEARAASAAGGSRRPSGAQVATQGLPDGVNHSASATPVPARPPPHVEVRFAPCSFTPAVACLWLRLQGSRVNSRHRPSPAWLLLRNRPVLQSAASVCKMYQPTVATSPFRARPADHPPAAEPGRSAVRFTIFKLRRLPFHHRVHAPQTIARVTDLQTVSFNTILPFCARPADHPAATEPGGARDHLPPPLAHVKRLAGQQPRRVPHGGGHGGNGALHLTAAGCAAADASLIPGDSCCDCAGMQRCLPVALCGSAFFGLVRLACMAAAMAAMERCIAPPCVADMVLTAGHRHVYALV